MQSQSTSKDLWLIKTNEDISSMWSTCIFTRRSVILLPLHKLSISTFHYIFLERKQTQRKTLSTKKTFVIGTTKIREQLAFRGNHTYLDCFGLRLLSLTGTQPNQKRLQSTGFGFKLGVWFTDSLVGNGASCSITYQGIGNAIHNLFRQFLCCFLNWFTRRKSNSELLNNNDHQRILVFSNCTSRTNIPPPTWPTSFFTLIQTHIVKESRNENMAIVKSSEWNLNQWGESWGIV